MACKANIAASPNFIMAKKSPVFSLSPANALNVSIGLLMRMHRRNDPKVADRKLFLLYLET